MAELDGRIPAVIDGGPCAVGIESTIISLEPGGGARLLRPGGIDAAALEAILGPLGHATHGKVESPGQVDQHYAPGTPAHLLQRTAAEATARDLAGAARIAVMRVVGPTHDPVVHTHLRALGATHIEQVSLSPRGDVAEAAHHLFATLRRLDEAGFERILFEPGPADEGLGHAIADRLRRAAAGSAPR